MRDHRRFDRLSWRGEPRGRRRKIVAAFQRAAADFRRKRSTDCDNPALPTQFDCHKTAHRSIMGRAEYCWPSPCLNERWRSREGTPVNVWRADRPLPESAPRFRVGEWRRRDTPTDVSIKSMKAQSFDDAIEGAKRHKSLNSSNRTNRGRKEPKTARARGSPPQDFPTTAPAAG